MRPLLVILHDLGSADPADILAAAGDHCDTLFFCDRNRPYVAAHFDEWARFAPVFDCTGLSAGQLVDAVTAVEPAGVTTFSDFRLRAAAAAAAACGLPGHSVAVAATLTDKFAQREAMRRAGVQATRCHLVRHESQAAAAVAAVGLPAVVKPRHGTASVNTCRVDSVEECAAAITGFRSMPPAGVGEELVVEELLVGDPSCAGRYWGDYVSVESVVTGGGSGGARHVCVTGRTPLAEPFRETGCFVPSTLPASLAAPVLDVVSAALRALGVEYGVTHTEVKLTVEGPRIIEVNGRMGGFVGDVLRRSTGYHLLADAIRLALGMPVLVPEPRPERVAFCWHLAAPASATRVPPMDAAHRFGQIPGVEQVELKVTAGDPLDWRRGTLGSLGVVHGAVADHEQLWQVLESLEKELQCQYA